MPQATAQVSRPTLSQATKAPIPSVSTTPVAIPQSQEDVNFLLDRRNELSTQLNSASSRRNDLSKQLRVSRAGPDQAGIESRISQLDGRIISIETEMADVGHALSAAPSGFRQTTTSTGVPPRPFGKPSSGQITAISIVGIIFVLAPLAFAMARMAVRRATHPPAPQIPKDVSDRLERMEQGIEAVALEVERIGEGQRFVTQLMSDRAQRAALPEGVPRT
jgi:hypothetical protein